MTASAAYAFGPYRMDVALRRLQRDGDSVALTPKAFDILVALIERRDRVVDKTELMHLVWPDSFVEESNLTQTIFVLRKTLGDEAGGQPYIETVPRRGYRFAAAVHEEGPPTPTVSQPRTIRPRLAVLAAGAAVAVAAVAMWIASRNDGLEIKSIAVLPLSNLSEQSGETYFTDGLTEALIADLAQIRSLRVVSRSSTVSYRNNAKPSAVVGRELGVDAFIEGSVVRSGDRVRVTVQLIHAASDRHVWSRTYEKRLEDILDLQREIARAVADEVSAALTTDERTRLARTTPTDPRAHDAYLRGRFAFNQRTRDGFQKAIGHFEDAIAIDPRMAVAYSGLADCYTLLAGFIHLAPHDAIPKAKAAAMKALEINPDLADAHVSLGFIRFRYDYEWPEAEAEFQRAIALNPNLELAHHWYGMSLGWVGRFDDAQREMNLAMQVDPLSLTVRTSAALVEYFARDYQAAMATFDRVLAIDPVNVVAFRRRGWVYQMQGRHTEAVASFERARELSKGDLIETAAVGRGYALAGRRDDALRLVAELQKRDPSAALTAYSIGEIFAALGEGDNAIRWLNRAYEARSIWLVWLKEDPLFDRLRNDPRFQEIVNRIHWQ